MAANFTMSLMQQLDEITEGDEIGDWGGSRSNSSQQVHGWYRPPNLQNSNRIPTHAGNSHQNHNVPQPDARTTFQGIRSLDVNCSYSEEESAIESNFKSSSNCGHTDDTSNIYHYTASAHEQVLSTNILSDKARSIFKFTTFNKMQSKSYKTMYEESSNCVISSPTGSGKTVLFELAILQLLNAHKDSNNLKILYIAPTKSLCIERERDWSSKFSAFGLSVGALTSDTSFLETDTVKKANIIITTPEKWDLMTRKWADYSKLFKLIKLLLIDEIHILRDNRGSTLEVVVTRMKKICHPLRIIALSATVPNIQDVSGWIKFNSASDLNAVTLVFGEEYRPVKLEKCVYGYKQTMNDFVFDSYLNSKLVEILREHSKDKPVLIFCPTRNSTIATARYLSKNMKLSVNNGGTESSIKEKELRELSASGFSYHHAGLSLPDRLSVERNFINGFTKVLCSTSTLAVGVNLPAYLVVIKGTKTWTGTSFEEYSELDILQMMGRAGRPQFETQGKAVLMTDSLKQEHYEKLVKGNEKLESRLHLNLSENLVPEIFLETVKSVESAIEWLKLTFFYSRFRANPTAYDEIPYIEQASIDARLTRYTESKLKELSDYKLISIVNGEYQCTPFGSAMTKHYVLFTTMKMFVKCSNNLGVSDILTLLSKSEEFSSIRLKRTEKKLYKELNQSPIMKYPFKVDNKYAITSNHEKISLIIQYELGGLEFPSNQEFLKLQQTFKQDKFLVFKHIGRLTRCLVDCFIEKNDFISLINCLRLYRCISGHCWEDSPIVLRQLEGIGIAAVRRFANHNIKSFDAVKNLSSGTIEYYINQRPGFGSKVLKDIEGLPTFTIDAHLESSKSKRGGIILATLRINIKCEIHFKSWHGKPLVVNVVTGLSTGEIVDFRRAHLNKLSGDKSFILEANISFKESKVMTTIFCENIGEFTSWFLLIILLTFPSWCL